MSEDDIHWAVLMLRRKGFRVYRRGDKHLVKPRRGGAVQMVDGALLMLAVITVLPS